MAGIVTLAAVPALAEDPKAEVGVTIAWVGSNGITRATNYVVPGVGTFNKVDPKSSFGWGFDVGFFVGPNSEMAGLGVTSWGTVPYNRPNGASGTLPGTSRFSTTWGGGVKFYGASKVGGRFGFRWTPAYVTSNATGWWCDPFWGCYLTGSAQYAQQFEINGGVTVRF